MSFYGNISNSVRSQFFFDKIYPNRKAMDDSASSDQVFLGRYVLVEYQSEMSEDYFPSNFFYSQGKLYNSINIEPAHLVTTNNSTLKHGDVVRILPNNNRQSANEVVEFYLVKVSGTNISATRITQMDENNPFWVNFNIDLESYFSARLDQAFPKGRGYDSTVWQKVYINEEGQEREKYVMIAELNSHAPIMDICADAPTTSPLTPHFDPDSTNAYYRLHVQPSWGMRVRPANPGDHTTETDEKKSDITADYAMHTYNPQTDKVTVSTTTDAPAAIYFNRAGFDKNTRGRDDITGNTITVLPTGVSGTQYYNHSNGRMEVKPDIQELTIQLPAIGNAISDFWDVMYGESRNLNIDWNDYSGLRFIKPHDHGGHFYDTNEVKTLAGSINSLHDLMGMIIKDVYFENLNDPEIQKLEDGYIYYNTFDRKFYRKGKQYTYDSSQVVWRTENGGPYYQENVTADNYLSNTYYIDDPDTGEKIPDISNVFKANQNYYTKQIEPGAKIPLERVLDYQKDKYYYYQSVGQRYYLSTTPSYYQGYDYKKIEIVKGPFRCSDPYSPDRYYIRDENGNIIHPTSETPEYSYDHYYDLKTSTRLQEDTYIYIPDYFYYKSNGEVFKEDAATFVSGKQYYKMQEDDKLKITFEPIKLISFEENKYFLLEENGDFTLITKPNEQLKQDPYPDVYTLELDSLENDFYWPNKFYYKENEDYIKAVENVNYSSKDYYELNILDITAFYEKDRFWYNNERYQMWMIDDSPTASQSEDKYYLSNTYYVISDGLKIMDEGAEWNGQIAVVPHSISIGTRQEITALKELRDFSRSYNTLHGIILQINEKLESDDMHTRNTRTLQGSLNFINDHINKISELYPGELVVVDNYGRMHSANLHTDEYLDVNIVPSAKRPEIYFKHTTPGVVSSNLVQTTKIPRGGSFNIPTFSTDTGGHVRDVNSTTISLDSNLNLTTSDIDNAKFKFDNTTEINVSEAVGKIKLLTTTFDNMVADTNTKFAAIETYKQTNDTNIQNLINDIALIKQALNIST